ncbi:hypothetical protein B0G81_4727 [Paraburkholderia sp. BL6665CI2N2]|nr:hypothetical protein B0G81_4727 [Paraburkholderia sp. BL6665CI2N2]
MNRRRKNINDDETEGAASPSKLKKTIDNNPLVVLAGVVVTSVTLAGAVTGWFWKESDQLKEIQYKNELNSTSSKLEAKISDLSLRLSSIERRVGDTKLFLDVLRIPITAQDINALPASYTSFDSGYFFVSVPASATWSGGAASQLDMGVAMLGDSARKMLDTVGEKLPVMAKKKGVLWKSSETVNAQLAPSVFTNQLGTDHFQFHPYLFVMGVDQAYISDVQKQFSGALNATPPQTAEISKSVAALKQLLSSDDKKGADMSASGASSAKAPASKKHRNVDVEQNILDGLAATSRGDLAGFLLIDALMSRFQMSLFTGGSVKIITTQKKGNVWYLRTQLVLPTVSGPDDKPVTSQVILDEELFFIGTARGGVLVRSGVPSLSLRSDAYTWTTSLLSSLRVTVD